MTIMFKQPYLPNQGKCIVVTPGSMSPGKKKYARGRGREYPPSSRVPQPRSQAPWPPPHDFLDQEFLPAELIADDDKEQKN